MSDLVDIHVERRVLGRLHTSALRLAFVMALVALCSIALNIVQVMTRPEPQYFAVDSQGTVVAIVPVDQPMLSNEALANWAESTVRKAYSLNFVDWRDQLAALRDRFAPKAYDLFLASMEQSNLPVMRENRLIYEVSSRPARITSAAVDGAGRYVWNVEVPVTVLSHFGGAATRSQDIVVLMEIVRVDNRFRPESGVVVTKFLTKLS